MGVKPLNLFSRGCIFFFPGPTRFGLLDFVCWLLHSIKLACWCWSMVIDWGRQFYQQWALFYVVKNSIHVYRIKLYEYAMLFFFLLCMMYLYTVFRPHVIPEISSKCASPRDTLNTKYMAPLLWIRCGTTTCDATSVRTGFVRRFCICKMWRMDNTDKEWEPKRTCDCYVL